jgi:GT2 family glycosyltransferase
MSNEGISAIVVYQRPDHVVQCLRSLEAQILALCEVIVVDNSLDRRFAERLRADFPRIRWLKPSRALSYGASLNAAIAVACGAYILCLNDDAALEPGYLSEAIHGFDQGLGVGMVSGKILRPDKVTLDSTGLFLSPVYTAQERGYGHRDDGSFDHPGPVFGVSGAVALYRREALDSVQGPSGPFVPRFGFFYEDLDLAWRLQRRGWKGFYASKARATHVRGATVRLGKGAGRWPARRYLSDDLHVDLVVNRYRTILSNERWPRFLLHLPLFIGYELALWTALFLFWPRVAWRVITERATIDDR